jgi:SAM-dependent methyltransferase
LRRRQRRTKPGGFIAGEAILFELSLFLETYYGGDGPDRAVLDIGAGTKPYAPLYSRYFDRCVSTDVATSPHDVSCVDVIAPAESLPFDDASFDAIICTEVLEHCRDPAGALAEVRRVLRPGGRAFITTPFLVGLHEMPYDFYRYTPSALQALAENAGLLEVAIRARGDYLALLLLTVGYPFSKGFQVLSKATRVNFHHPANPIVYLTLVLPQRIYLAFWRAARSGRRPALRRLHEKLSHMPLGYTTILERPAR